MSPSTASRVLTGKPNVSPEARKAVLAASKRLNYRGDPNARALRTDRTGMIGMLVPDIANPFFAELIEASARALEAADIDLLLADSHGSLEREQRWLVNLRERRVDGMLIVPVHHQHSRPALAQVSEAVPVVQIDRQVDHVAADFVGIDNRLAQLLILNHLLAQGVERVGVVSGHDPTLNGRGRGEDFEVAATRTGSLSVAWTMIGEFSTTFGRQAAQRMLATEAEMPEAIVCGSDTIAFGVMGELKASGLRIPEDVLLVGFDGVTMSELVDPPLTTIRQPLDTIASEARRLLQQRIAGGQEPPQRIEIAPQLICRGSSSRAASDSDAILARLP